LSIPEKEVKKLALQAVGESFSGPLPPPNILAQYDQIVPGAGERIISMAENQASHRQDIEKKVIESDIKHAGRGLHYGLIIGLVSVIGGVICIMYGHEVGGSIVGGTGLTGLVGVFVYGSRQRRKEREARFRAEVESNK
jgi:uncharacterized membrane protein